MTRSCGGPPRLSGLLRGRRLRLGRRGRRDRVVVALLGRRHGCERRARRLDAQDLVDLALDLVGDLRVLAQVALHVVAPLPHPLVAIREERAGLLDDPVLDAEVEDAALARDALAVLDVELGLAERRR